MARTEITALRGKVLMGVSCGCLWDGQAPEVDAACFGIWLKLAHEKVYLENAGGEILVVSKKQREPIDPLAAPDG